MKTQGGLGSGMVSLPPLTLLNSSNSSSLCLLLFHYKNVLKLQYLISHSELLVFSYVLCECTNILGSVKLKILPCIPKFQYCLLQLFSIICKVIEWDLYYHIISNSQRGGSYYSCLQLKITK